MVNKSLSRKRVLCPNGHEIITRKIVDIQCKKCVAKGIHSRFTIKTKTDTILAEMAEGLSKEAVS